MFITLHVNLLPFRINNNTNISYSWLKSPASYNPLSTKECLTEGKYLAARQYYKHWINLNLLSAFWRSLINIYLTIA